MEGGLELRNDEAALFPDLDGEEFVETLLGCGRLEPLEGRENSADRDGALFRARAVTPDGRSRLGPEKVSTTQKPARFAASMYTARAAAVTFVLSMTKGCRAAKQASRRMRSRLRVRSMSRLSRTWVSKKRSR